jgi:murein DD-endopeptidase MepM/ murein hydrolase activator NlpD
MVYIDGQSVLAVKDTADFDDIIEELKLNEEEKYNHELEISNKIEIKPVLVAKEDIVPYQQMQKKIKEKLDFKVNAAAIVVEGKNIAFVENKEAAEQILQNLKNEHAKIEENEKLLDVSFKEKVVIKDEQVSVNDLMSIKETRELITTGTKNPEKYIVQEGDSLWWIARKNDMYVDDIVQANKLKSEDLSLGQELIVVKSKPYVNVIAKVQGEKTENIPYETRVIVDNNSSRAVNVKQAGKEGKKQIEYIATRLNGTIEEREIIKEKILSNAVDRVLVKGTQVVQVASRGGGTGALDWPVYGPITQYYKGTNHTGLDIGGKTGTVLKAADNGYVTFAGWSGGYGNLIIVDHGNGIVTRYAHCSSFIASVGQKVSRGQGIARLGSTGRSSGPHLHFEVLSYGAFQNPLNSLR